jgi:Sap, sulfolipid-1-addressing protein
MGAVLLQILPLALGAIAPTMIGLVVFILNDARGLLKAFTLVLGKYIVYVFWGLISLSLVGYISPSGSGKKGDSVLPALFLIFGLLLLILAARNFLGEDDPDAPPPKILKIVDKIGPLKFIGVGVLLSLVQPRFIMLVLVGAAIITNARLRTSENIISVFLLALLMVWVMLIPIIMILVMGERGDNAMKSMRVWLTHNQRKLNVAVMGIFGIGLVIVGLIGIFG